MIPDHVVSNSVVYAPFISPDGREPDYLVDYERGGVDLNDATRGMDYQIWRCRLFRDGVSGNSYIYLKPGVDPEYLYLTLQDVRDISFTFDQNMNPIFAYTQGSEVKMRWYDNTIPGFATLTLPANSRSAKVALDDKRDRLLNNSDVILSYMRGDTLYFREQRDRYTVEYTLQAGLSGDLIACGMNEVNRFQWNIGSLDYPTGTFNLRVDTSGRQRKTTTGQRRRIVGINYG